MPTTKFIDPGVTLVIDTPQALSIADPRCHGLIDAVTQLNAGVPLAKVRCKWVESNKWRYTFEASDGRTWPQDMFLTEGRFQESFDTNALWWDDEYPAHRFVRQFCKQLIVEAGATDIVCTWTP